MERVNNKNGIEMYWEKASDVNKYFNFIVQKLTMQTSKKYPILN